MKQFNLDGSLGALVSKTHWHMKTYFTKMIRQHGLDVTPEQWAVLLTISRIPGIPQTELARRTWKDKTTITRILDVLAKHGYITRQPDPQDRRKYNIYLTDEGEVVLERLIAIATEVNNTFKHALTPSELHYVTIILPKICQQLEELLTE